MQGFIFLLGGVVFTLDWGAVQQSYVNVYVIAKNSVKDTRHEYTATNHPGKYTFK